MLKGACNMNGRGDSEKLRFGGEVEIDPGLEEVKVEVFREVSMWESVPQGEKLSEELSLEHGKNKEDLTRWKCQ